MPGGYGKFHVKFNQKKYQKLHIYFLMEGGYINNKFMIFLWIILLWIMTVLESRRIITEQTSKD